MPTKNPRVYVTLSEETYEVIRDVASISGTSMSKVIAEMADLARPGLALSLEAMRAYQAADAESRARIAAALEEVGPRVDASMLAAQGEVEGAYREFGAAFQVGESDPE